VCKFVESDDKRLVSLRQQVSKQKVDKLFDMKFQIQSKILQQQLTSVSKVISGKSAMAILDNFLLKLEGDVLSVTGSDQENVMCARFTVDNPEGEGSVAIPAKRILDILKEVPDQMLTVYINDQNKEVDIRFSNGHFNFMGVDGSEYPVKEFEANDTTSLLLPASVILSGIENTIFAVSSETIRPIMTGICWDFKEDKIIFVASDSHKLVKYENLDVTPGFERQFVLPQKPASIMKNLLSKETGDVKLTIDEKSALFQFGDYTLSCRFVKGDYPPYERVIPQENPFELTIDRVSLLNAVRRVALLANMASNLVRFNIQHNELLLSSQDLDYSTSAEERMICEYSGNPMTIGFHAGYMVEILSNLKGDTIVCKLADPSRAAVLMPEVQNENERVLMLLMPMQVLDY